MYTLIKNGILINPATQMNEQADILIRENIIEDIGVIEERPEYKVIDAANKIVVPGLIDIHVHFREPGFEDKETIATGAKAAVAGGFTSVVCMPNTKPVIDSIEIINEINDKGKDTECNIFMMGSITKCLEGHCLNDYQSMKEAGIVGITDDGLTVESSKVMYEAFQEAKKNDLTVSVHCEDKQLIYDNTVNQGAISQKLGMIGRPNVSEDVIVQRDILLAEAVDAKVHIQHISSANSIDIVRESKKKGIRVTCEATPHHFALTEDAVLQHQSNAKMSPPLRSEQDRQSIIQGIKDGTVDIIATDHAPHTIDDKDKPFLEAANGIIGIETAFGLAATELIHTGIIDMNKLVELMSCNPSNLLGLDKGNLSIGKDADITIVDLNEEWVVDKNQFQSKGRNTPFNGKTLKGRVYITIVNGEIKYSRC